MSTLNLHLHFWTRTSSKFLQPKSLWPLSCLISLQVECWTQESLNNRGPTHKCIYLLQKSSFTAIEPHDTQQAVFITVDFSSCPLLPLSTVTAQFISPLNLTFLGWRGLFFSLVKWAAADSSLTTHHDWPLISPSPYFPNEIVSPDLQVKTLM